MENTNGYIHDGKWKDDAANGQYLFATKDGRDYFLKRFREPKYPKEGISPKGYEAKKKECEAWKKERKEIIDALQNVAGGGGNIVAPLEIFLEKPCYIQATYKVDTSTKGFEEIADLSEDNFLLLLKTLSMSMRKVHSVNIVHGDLKPDNILISETKGGKTVCKIIDFDDSYFAKRPPKPSNTVGTEAYWSPELALYKISDDESRAEMITCKSDVFALGLIFHQYCTGGKLPDLQDYTYAYQTVFDGKEIKADDSIKPAYLKTIINQMLSLNPADRPTCEEIFAKLSNPETIEEPMSKVRAIAQEDLGNALVDGKEEILVKKGTVVKFVAKPKSGYEFDYWKLGTKKISQAEYSVEIDGDIVAMAYFKKKKVEETVKWPKIEIHPKNPNKVNATFENGKTKVVDKAIAETMGWL